MQWAPVATSGKFFLELAGLFHCAFAVQEGPSFDTTLECIDALQARPNKL
jgi:hypothetical protein